jgi:hypothetical protein
LLALPFDVAAIKRQMEAAPGAAPYPYELSAAIVSDTFRLGGLAPPAPRLWSTWRKKWPRAAELTAELARVLVVTSLRAETVGALERLHPAAQAVLQAFLEATSPLTAEMIRTNAFRQEEFLRNWIAACGGQVAGETARQSRSRLENLDYRKALAQYRKAEAARKVEAERRAQLLREAAQRREYAKGWRE